MGLGSSEVFFLLIVTLSSCSFIAGALTSFYFILSRVLPYHLSPFPLRRDTTTNGCTDFFDTYALKRFFFSLLATTDLVEYVD